MLNATVDHGIDPYCRPFKSMVGDPIFPDTGDEVDDSWFNDNIDLPYWDPTDSKHSLLGKLMAMIQFMTQNPGNLKAPQALMQFISKLEKANPALARTLLNEKMTIIDPITGKATSMTLLAALISSQIVAKYYFEQKVRPLPDDFKDFFNQLTNMFSGDPYFYKQAQDEIARWSDPNNWMSFLIKHSKDGKPDMSWEDYKQAGTMFFDKFSLSHWFRTFANKELVNQMMKIAGPYGAQLLLALLMNYMDGQKVDTVGFYGNNAAWMKKRTTEIADLTDLWNKGNFTADSATDFIKQIKAFLAKLQDPKADGIRDTVSKALENLLSMKWGDKSLNDWFKDANSTNPATKAIGMEMLKTALNGWNMPPDPKTPPPQQFTQIEGYFKTSTSAFSDQSQTITTALQKVTADEQAYDGIMGKSLTDLLTLINDIIKHLIAG